MSLPHFWKVEERSRTQPPYPPQTQAQIQAALQLTLISYPLIMSTPVMSPVNPVSPVTPEAERLIVAEEAKVVAGKSTKPADTKDCAMEDATSDATMVSCAKHLYVATAAVNRHV